MKKTSKTIGTIKEIKSIALTTTQQQTFFDIMKNKVEPKQKLMIAVSGGADSILTACLMYNFFLKNKYNLQNLYFIHCNHNTRSGNAADQRFIEQFFKGTSLIIVKRPSNTPGNEATLRNRRYKEFKKQTKKKNIDQLVFGHNLTDRIESTFLNLLRGANLNGFIAMQEQETHHLLPDTTILRPILGWTKEEIVHICNKNKIPFITDPTNKDTATSLRNKLRNTIFPQMYKLAHKQTATTNSFIESMKNIYEQLEKTSERKNIILKAIDILPYRNAKFAYQRIIDPKDVNTEQILQMLKKLHSSNNITTPLLKERAAFIQNNESGYKYFNNMYLFKSHGKIYCIAGPKLFREKTIDRSQKISTLGNKVREGKTYTITGKECIGAEIRFPRKGDTYKKKTRNEWCINQKIPIFQRNFVPIVVKKNQIIKIFK